jgi:uncharacterized membrane protein HdeD (DUF308 family)
MGPLILIVLGILFLMSNIYPDTFSFGRLWPVILIVIGVVKIVESFQKRPSGPSGPSGKDAL